MDLLGKTAIVTGAARGIGLAISLELAREGMNLVAVDLKKGEMETLVDEIMALGKKILPLEADVTSLKLAERMTSQAIHEFGQIDVLVNNAGVIIATPFTAMTREEWDRVINVNLGGVFNCCKAVVSHMIKNRSGRIINISSVAGKRAAPLISAYSASKFGVIGLTQALAIELGPYDITANAVCPGFINTAMWRDHLNPALSPLMGVGIDEVFDTFTKTNVPLQRSQTPEDVAQCVAFLCKADNISGVAVNVDGGHNMI